MLSPVSDTAGLTSGAVASLQEGHHQPKERASSGDRQLGQFLVANSSGSPGNWMSTTSPYADWHVAKEFIQSVLATLVRMDLAESSIPTIDPSMQGCCAPITCGARRHDHQARQ